jgi:hypothetical protein
VLERLLETVDPATKLGGEASLGHLLQPHGMAFGFRRDQARMSTQAVDHPTKQVNILPALWMGVLVGEETRPSSVGGVSCVAKVADNWHWILLWIVRVLEQDVARVEITMDDTSLVEDGDCRPDLEDAVPNDDFGEAGSLRNEKIEASAVYILVYEDALSSL